MMNPTIFGTGIGVLMLLISFFFTGFMTNDPVWGIGIGLIIGLVPYFWWVLPHVSCNPPGDKAWILENRWKRESSKLQTNFSGYREIRAQREVQAGFHWKYPWEKPGKEINMSRQIVVENEKGKEYTMQDGKTIELKWRIFCVPLPGNILNYIRTRPEDIQRRVHDRAEAFLQGYIGGLKSIGFGKRQMDEIKAEFEKIYGGPSKIDEEERALGIWTGTPEILDIDQPETVQEAKNFTQIMEAKIKIANEMVAASGGKLTFQEAMKLVLIGDNKADVNFVELAGVFPTGGSRGKKKKNNQPQGDDDGDDHNN